jgi:DnaJ-domain-containing protein 1
MKSMSKKRVGEFMSYLKSRIERHNQKMTGAIARHRVLIKTERAEAEVILETFMEILNEKR